MPHYIHDEKTGKSTRVWSKTEWDARYQQGQFDGGNRSPTYKPYTEEAMRAAYQRGVATSQRLWPPVIRAAFDKGWQEGEANGMATEKQAFATFIEKELKQAKTRGYDQAKSRFEYQLNSNTIRLKKVFSSEELNYAAWFSSNDARKFEQYTIKTYKIENSWPMRAGKAYDLFMATRQNGFLHNTFTFLGSLPMGKGKRPNLSGFNSTDWRGFDKVNLQLSDVRTMPWSILRRFSGRYIFIPYALYKTYEYLNSDEDPCSALTALTPTLFNVTDFTQEQKNEIANCTSRCKENHQDWQKGSANISNLVDGLTRYGLYQQKKESKNTTIIQEDFTNHAP